MERRLFLAGAAGLVAGPALALTASSTPAIVAGVPPKPAKGVVRVRIETALGAIVLELRGDKAPITTANFCATPTRSAMIRRASIALLAHPMPPTMSTASFRAACRMTLS